MILVLLAFVCGVGMDIVWTCCVHSIQARKPIMAANMSVLIFGFALVSTVIVVEKCTLAIVAYAIGNWIGTYITVKKETW
ncbi:MAG: hypothetical protein ABSG67_01390 [Thermoguttaceae bacterium]